MRKGQDQSGFFYFFLQLLSFFELEGNRFVYHNVESSFQRHHSRFEVPFVWGNNRNKVHPFAFGEAYFVFKHFRIGFINPAFGQEVGASRTEGDVGVYTETAAYQLYLVVHKCSAPVNGAYESIASSAYHSHS